MSRTLAPCGTKAARRRHKARGETCTTCTPKPFQLEPCGTRAAWRRHHRRNETPCQPCDEAIQKYHNDRRVTDHRDYNRTPLPQILEEITFLLNAGEGTHRILQATGYLGREQALRERLRGHGHGHLANRILNPWELAA